MEYNPNNFASKNQSSSLQTKQTVLQNPSVNSMFINEKKLNQNETMKNTNKRNFEEHEDPFSNTNNEKKRMKIDNYTTFNKNETLILTKNSKNSSFQERFEGLLKDYSESLKNSIEKTLSEMKNEGFIVSDNF